MNVNDFALSIADADAQEAIYKTERQINRHDNILCSVSGGADSDIVIDILERVKTKDNITYLFFNTGLEYQATKDHLKYLESKYNIKIQEAKAVKPIPLCVKEYGVPFLSKQVSEFIERLQRHNFKWENKPFAELLKEYPKCKAALRWWCNEWGENSRVNISRHSYLKEFMTQNPPNFKISNKCCYYGKKLVALMAKAAGGYDLSITGIRKAEGGARATAYKSCFSPANDKTDIAEFRPIFWFKNATKKLYVKTFNIKHSDCYLKWGLPRTGCAGCPYAKDFENELEAVRQNEPKMYIALLNVFGKSYEYTRKYREYQKKMKEGGKQ